MKRIILFCLLAVITVISAGAANNASEARKLLDKAAAKVNLNKGATASFSISGGKFNVSGGTLSVKGKKFQATTGNAIIWYNGSTQWLYNKKNSEVNVSTPSAAQQQSMNPYTFLNLYKSGYTMSYKAVASGNEVHLVGKGKSISELYILLDKSSTIKQIRMKQNGKWITINISNFRQASLSDSQFQFNAKDYPKAEIIDLR